MEPQIFRKNFSSGKKRAGKDAAGAVKPGKRQKGERVFRGFWLPVQEAPSFNRPLGCFRLPRRDRAGDDAVPGKDPDRRSGEDFLGIPDGVVFQPEPGGRRVANVQAKAVSVRGWLDIDELHANSVIKVSEN